MICDRDSAINQLKRDKHTLLEGYVTEFLFERQFLKSRSGRYTHGWWSGIINGERFFFVLKEQLSSLDQEVLTVLNTNYNCWQAIYKNGEWIFGKDEMWYSQSEFLNKFNLVKRQAAVHATSDTTDIDRQNKCIDFFDANSIIICTAIERNFADDFLSVYFKGILNVDYFTKNKEGNLCVVEVKFKNESYDGVFGINIGEVALFTELRRMGFKVIHTILYKNRENKEMSIFDYLNSNTIEHAWYIGVFDEKDLDAPAVAPSKTSVDGKKNQYFYKLKKSKMIQNNNKKILDFNGVKGF